MARVAAISALLAAVALLFRGTGMLATTARIRRRWRAGRGTEHFKILTLAVSDSGAMGEGRIVSEQRKRHEHFSVDPSWIVADPLRPTRGGPMTGIRLPAFRGST